jgi:DNA-directed RNA polymerase specialized sigma subunit
MYEREQWKSIATGITPNYGGERVQSSGSKQKMADAVSRYVDIEKEIDAAIDDLINRRNDVIAVIEQLDAVQYDILHKIYVQYLTLYEVADIYDRTYSNITTIHGKALKNVQEILENRKSSDAE